MSRIADRMTEVLARPKDELIDVGALLERTPPDAMGEAVPEMDLKLRNAYNAGNAARRVLLIHRPPRAESYDPAKALRDSTSGTSVPVEEAIPDTAPRFCVGDKEQVVECVRLVLQNVQLQPGAGVRTEVTTDAERPRVVLRITGPGQLPERISVDGFYQMDLEEFAPRWIAATQGGHIALAEEGMILYLEGEREPPELDLDLERPLEAMRKLTRLLRSWRGAMGHYEPGMVSNEEILSLYRDTVTRALELVNAATAGPT